MTSDNNLFDLSTSLLPQYDDTGQPRPPVHPMQQHYSESWNSLALNSPYLLSPQDGPWSYQASNFPAQDAGNRSQQTQNAQDTLLDLGPLSPNRDAANKVDMQSLLKPAAEGWRPPFLPRPYDGTEAYQNNTYTRSTGVMSEPFGNEDAYSFVGSDFAPTYDSGFYSGKQNSKRSSLRQDAVTDHRSEISEMIGDQLPELTERPYAGRIMSDPQVVTYNGKRRRSSQPLPLCEYCKDFRPKNRSDKMYVTVSATLHKNRADYL